MGLHITFKLGRGAAQCLTARPISPCTNKCQALISLSISPIALLGLNRGPINLTGPFLPGLSRGLKNDSSWELIFILYFISSCLSSRPVFKALIQRPFAYRARCEESDFITHLRLTERTTAGEREGEVKKLNGLWVIEGHHSGFVILNVIFGINFLLHNTSLQSGAGVCLWSRVFTKHCKGLRFALCLFITDQGRVCPGAERYKERRALQAHLCVFCTHMKTYITATMLNCKITFCDSRIHVYSC